MKNNKKFLLITGGTGGHVLPAQNLANYFIDNDIECEIVIDKRGYKYLNNFKGKVYLINSSNLSGGIISKIFGLFKMLIGFIQSLRIIIFQKPNTVISFGSYASFLPILSCIVTKPFFRTKIFIHEQNSILGRTNSFFLIFASKLLLNFDISSRIKNKYKSKIFVVGMPDNNNLNKISNKYNFTKNEFIIFISGGSQGSEYVSKFASNLIKTIDKENIINVSFIFQSPKHLIKKISEDLKYIKLKIIIKEYYSNIEEILEVTSLAISRAGAGSISDLIKYEIPSLLIPLPNSKDNHQFFNASILETNKLAIILDQKNQELDKAKKYIYNIYKNNDNNKVIKNRFNKIKVRNSNSLIYKLIVDEEKN